MISKIISHTDIQNLQYLFNFLGELQLEINYGIKGGKANCANVKYFLSLCNKVQMKGKLLKISIYYISRGMDRICLTM